MGKHHRQPPPPPPHACPGGCGADIRNGLMSCASCWYLLPAELRLRIVNGDKPTKAAATEEALVWFKNNTVGGVPL